jgi:hypothetical protein
MGPANTDEKIVDGAAALGTNCNDKLSFTLTSNAQMPILCGILTGEHIYMDMGPDSTDNAKISLSLTSTTVVATTSGILSASNQRVWSFQTSQIPCWAPYRAPDGCHRYIMQHSGHIASYNFVTSTVTKGDNLLNQGQELANQFVKTCIRREKGMCCTLFQVCNSFGGIDLTEAAQNGGANTAGTLNQVSEGWSFDQQMNAAQKLISPLALAAMDATTNDFGGVDAGCTGDYVEIPDSTTGNRNLGAAEQVNTRYCGVRFGNLPPISATGALDHAPVYDCTEPWEVNFRTDNVNDSGQAATDAAYLAATPARGFCLEFFQEAC